MSITSLEARVKLLEEYIVEQQGLGKIIHRELAQQQLRNTFVIPVLAVIGLSMALWIQGIYAYL
jgi:hypothetical protein